MGSIVTYTCGACSFATEQLSVGWGKAGRAAYWGGLALCPECKDITALNLGESRADRRDRRCSRCNAPLRLIEGTSERIPCPRCGQPLRQATLGTWS
jgi:phage FluMu protein Com